MPSRVICIFLTSFVLALLLGPVIDKHGHGSVWSLPTAMAQDMPASLNEAHQSVSAKRVPGEKHPEAYCAELGSLKSEFYFKCPQDMLPFKQDEAVCKQMYRQIMKMKACPGPLEWQTSRYMVRGNKCKTYKSMLSSRCGQNMDPNNQKACNLTSVYLRKNCG